MTVKIPLFQPIRFGRHDDLRSLLSGQIQEMIGVVGLVGNGLIRMKARNQVTGRDNVMDIAAREMNPDRIAQFINNSMDLGC